jgi:hypothetical protein
VPSDPGSAAAGAVPADGAFATPGGAVPAGPPPAAVTELLAEVSEERLRTTVDRLAGFGTRHTLSDTASESRGIGAARRWIRGEMEAAAAASGRTGEEAMRVGFDAHTYGPDDRRIDREVEIVNVVAELPGAMPEARGRRYYVIGHYDSRNSDEMDREGDAPGADDDGSGTALVVELARVLARHRFDATVVLMATAGEEQGLLGARLHAAAAREAGVDVRAVLSNDIVGDPSSPLGGSYPTLVRVFSPALPREPAPEELARIRSLAAESDSPSRQLARFVAETAAWHDLGLRPMLVFRPDRFLRGGDHTAFVEQGFPGVRFTEVSETYARQHQDVRVEDGVSYGDLPEHVDAGYLAGVARVNAAALVHLANAPSPPAEPRMVVSGLANDTTLAWEPSPEPDVAGYEVVWRPTTSPVWTNAQVVGAVTRTTLPLSKDDLLFGVRAYDRDGFRSPVAFAGVERE